VSCILIAWLEMEDLCFLCYFELMNVIALRTLRAFWEIYPEAESPLRDWNKLARATHPRHFADLKTTFGSVDVARAKDDTVIFIFDVGGNKFRLVARIDFEYNVLFILVVLNHKEYDLWNKEGRPL
jgi:mRNA interferase HigB